MEHVSYKGHNIPDSEMRYRYQTLDKFSSDGLNSFEFTSEDLNELNRIVAEKEAELKERGYDGIFITDHFFHGNTRPSRELSWPEYVDAYMKGYEEAKRAGDAIGFKVFFGIEENFEGDEFLIYGVDKQFLLDHPTIPHWTREEMIKWVHEAGGAVMQAHPFRERKESGYGASRRRGAPQPCPLHLPVLQPASLPAVDALRRNRIYGLRNQHSRASGFQS